MSPEPRETESNSSDRREAILAAALSLFAERGFHGTAVPLIAERAGVGAGTIYRYFESKEALVNELYQRWKSRLGAALLADFPVDAPMRQQFRHFWRGMFDFARRHPDVFAFLELHHHAPYLDARSREIEMGLLMTTAAVLERAAAQQAVKPMPVPLLMAVVWGALVGVLKAHQLGHLGLDDAVIDAAETCAWEAIRR